MFKVNVSRGRVMLSGLVCVVGFFAALAVFATTTAIEYRVAVHGFMVGSLVSLLVVTLPFALVLRSREKSTVVPATCVKDLRPNESAFIDPRALYEADGSVYVEWFAGCGERSAKRTVEVTRLTTDRDVLINVDEPLPPLRKYDSADGYAYPHDGDYRAMDIIANKTEA